MMTEYARAKPRFRLACQATAASIWNPTRRVVLASLGRSRFPARPYRPSLRLARQYTVVPAAEDHPDPKSRPSVVRIKIRLLGPSTPFSPKYPPSGNMALNVPSLPSRGSPSPLSTATRRPTQGFNGYFAYV